MKVVFDTEGLEPLKHLSEYNKNYYRLPFSIGGCEILYVVMQNYSEVVEYNLGNLNDDVKFETIYTFDGDLDGNVELIDTSWKRTVKQ